MAEQTRGSRSQAPGYLVAGRYRLVSRISSGGMGAVWLARDDLLGREVALKQVLPQAGADVAQAAEQRERSLREGRIAARLTHPHVIAMYDVALDGGEPWLVMEYLPSRSLAAVLKATGPLPAAEVARIGVQLSDALAAAHSVGIVHRDVKPGNVLIAEGGRPGTVKITDFGISRAYGDVTLTQTGILHGTPAFLTPEVARGGDPTAASDVFSLGATLLTAVEGAPPFGFDDNTIALLHRVARGEVASPQRAGAMTATLLHMLEPNPEHRLTMSQARDALTAAENSEHGYPATVPTRMQVDPPDTTQHTRIETPVSTPPAARRRPSAAGWIAAGVVMLLLLAAVGIVALTRNGDSSAAQGPLPATTPTPTATPTPTPTPTPSPTAASTSATTAPTTTAPTTTAPTTTATTTTATTTPSPTPTTTSPSATTSAARTLTADSATSAVRAYYALLPTDTSTAFTRLGPKLKAQGFADYNGFWNSFQRVTAQDASSNDGGSTVTVTVDFDRGKGPTIEEVHQLAMLPGDSGALINMDTLVSSRKGK